MAHGHGGHGKHQWLKTFAVFFLVIAALLIATIFFFYVWLVQHTVSAFIIAIGLLLVLVGIAFMIVVGVVASLKKH